MPITSISFIIFLAVIAGIYFVMPAKKRWMVLLAASYIFYLLASPKSFVFLLITTVTTYYGGRQIGKCEERYRKRLSEGEFDRAARKELKAESKKEKKKWMLAVLILNFGILAVMKYFGTYIDMLAELLHADWMHVGSSILIPLGISFYTFQSMSYIIDLYRGKYDPDTSLVRFALFVSWFPLIIQGPISRYDQLALQLYEGHEFDYTRVTRGAQLIMWGFFKKLVIADRVAVLVSTVFDNYKDYSGVYVIAGIVGYSIQLYADFSGGMDISQGVSQIFGIKLIENFERPYFSLNMNEFWRRWHVSLGNWCRDYIFYPISLSKSFSKMTKKARNIFGDRIGKLTPIIIAQTASFVIIGIWHGAQIKYLVYGFYQAFFINIGLIFQPQFKRLAEILRINTDAWSWKLFLMIRTFTLITIGRFFDRGPRFLVAVRMIRAMFVFNPEELFNGGIFTLGMLPRDFQLIAVCLLIWLGVSIAQEKGYVIRDVIGRQNLLFRWFIYLGGFIAIIVFGVYGVGYDANTFIYRTF